MHRFCQLKLSKIGPIVIDIFSYLFCSQQFLPRDAMHKRGLCRHAVSVRGRRMQGGMKNDDFRPISRYISEMMQDRTIVTMESK